MPKKQTYSFLRGEIRKKFDTEGQFATALGITQQALSNKLNGKNLFSQKEMKKIAVILDLEPVVFYQCFFVD